ncbi:ASKHA domain-containing protein [Treponema sp.]|uniref:ASKHA domain-containing protein n=1 Tax=Treponema sp. TaxID=166 RepID=UPI0025D4474C|nr:ASKHA domain-containing protein [Treponema sp.]MCR5217599.1 ASKHA domain-containing protein [Treponema sp.]
MICKKCNGCGLCQGDGSFEKSAHALVENMAKKVFKGDDSFSANEAGIAVDVGTTTIAAAIFSLKDGRLLFECGEKNQQGRFGSDVLARINAAERDYDGIRSTLIEQLKKIIVRLTANASVQFLASRAGRLVLRRIVFTGNTSMMSFVAGKKVSGLKEFPFTIPSEFGFSTSYNQVFASHEYGDNCEVYFPPVISAFVGADTVCAMTSCFNESDDIQFMADTGTNCEMAVYDKKAGKVVCTSSSAGPAFEASGISCGMVCSEGAVASLKYDGKNFIPLIIGGKKALGICGTGLLSAVCTFYREGFIDRNGTIQDGEKINLSDEVSVSQEDIRKFQLAKAAVYTGLNFLNERVESGRKKLLYLCGGFGSHIDPSDALNSGMIPDYFKGNVFHCGNSALEGAAAMLFDMNAREKGKRFALMSQVINLALEESFQDRYISALNLPEKLICP